MIKLKVENGKVGHGVPFERLRRVSGYLAPTARFTLAKQAELRDRVKHSLEMTMPRVNEAMSCGPTIRYADWAKASSFWGISPAVAPK